MREKPPAGDQALAVDKPQLRIKPSNQTQDPIGTMAKNRSTSTTNKLDQVVAEARRARDDREKGYREQALKLYPWICGRCGREFNLRNLQELTVHHKNHNHDDNPSDGSNWELLCLYCHDEEHARQVRLTKTRGTGPEDQGTTFKAFAGLEGLLKNSKE
jgi:hypothetical protein